MISAWHPSVWQLTVAAAQLNSLAVLRLEKVANRVEKLLVALGVVLVERSDESLGSQLTALVQSTHPGHGASGFACLGCISTGLCVLAAAE
jgi:hypothetical protein